MNTPDHLDELDSLFGPTAVMDLEQRGLLPDLAGIDRSITPGAGDRVVAALLGAAIGNALGRPTCQRSTAEVARRFGPVTGYVRSPRSRAPLGALGAEGRLFVSWAGELDKHGRSAAPALAERLPRRVRSLRRPGAAITTTAGHLRQGAPWYAAAPDSFGNGALLRAVADGARWATEADWRPTGAALGAVVTHAHPRAVAASMVLAELIAAGVADPDALGDPIGLAHELAGRIDDPTLADSLRRLPRSRGNGATAEDSLTRALALFARHADPEAAVVAAVNAGGASDVVAGVVGALAGARHGLAVFPADWQEGVQQRDRVRRRGRRLAEAQDLATTDRPTRPMPTAQERRRGADGELEPVHLWFLLDRSGSMKQLEGAAVRGFNGFLDEQRTAEGGRARLTLVQFDSEDPFEVLVDGRDLREVPELRHDQFHARGLTPLYDAIGSLIDAAENDVQRRAKAGQAEEDLLLVVFTDGMENNSTRWDRTEIFSRVETKKAAGWTFVFMGANQDSYASGRAMAVASGNVSNWDATPEGHQLAYGSASRATREFRAKPRAARRRDRDDFFGGVKEAEER